MEFVQTEVWNLAEASQRGAPAATNWSFLAKEWIEVAAQKLTCAILRRGAVNTSFAMHPRARPRGWTRSMVASSDEVTQFGLHDSSFAHGLMGMAQP